MAGSGLRRPQIFPNPSPRDNLRRNRRLSRPGRPRRCGNSAGPITIWVGRATPGIRRQGRSAACFTTTGKELNLASATADVGPGTEVGPRLVSMVVVGRTGALAARSRCSPFAAGNCMARRFGRDENLARLRAARPAVLPSLLACDFGHLERGGRAGGGGRRAGPAPGRDGRPLCAEPQLSACRSSRRFDGSPICRWTCI